MGAQTTYALLVVAALVVIAAALGMAARRGHKDGYLVYPYLDLDSPGERGSYYALAESS